MPFPFKKIFQQAIKLTQINRFLWLYGLLILSLAAYPWAKSGSILAIAALVDKKETDFAKSFETGSFFAARIVLLAFLIAVFLWLVYLWSLAVFVPLLIFICGLVELSCLFVVLHDMKVADSVSSALGLWAKHWPIILVLTLSLSLISAVLPAAAAVVFFRFYGSISMAFVALFFLLLASLPIAFSQVAWVLAFQELVKPVKLEESKQAEAPATELAT